MTDSGYEAEIIVSGLDYLSSHNVAVTVWDALAEVEQTVRVNPGIPVFDWGPEDFAFHVPVTVQGTNIREKLQGALDIMVDRSGDIMEGPLDMGGNQLTGLPEPTQDTDAAPKSYVDGKLSMCKVWTNESPEENFAAQEVALELKNASGVSIRYKNQANGTACKTTGFVPMGGAVMLQYVPADGVPKRRECTVSETGVTFETGYDGDTSGTKNCIPLEIYAWYGTTSSVTGDNTGGSGETGDTETDDDSETVTVGTTQSNSVKKYGAVGDGITDDTAAFTEALASERVVYVPGGTYLLSDALVIGENCCLELSQDTVLQFTLTSGNCITLEMSASLRGNHATINVPYAFTGYVINADSTTTTSQSETPPWSKWDPQWKSGRYVTDLNICKPDSRGFHYSVDGGCNGTAVYISADGSATQSFVWGLHFSGLRIAGAFSYGIRAVNFNDGWAHEMRVDAFIDACEIGVSLESCNNAYISAIVQPRRAYTTAEVYIPYAKHGIQLINSKNVDLSGSRVWDWNAEYTMWTDGGEYQHLALVGQCRGLILNDFLYYEQSTIDIRDLIYTDTPSNLEQMTILQEPFTRWFKPIDNEPYFFNGDTDKRLVLKDEFDECFDTDRVLGFTDMLSTAIDEAGAVYNEIGYKEGVRIVQSTGAESSTSSDSYYVSTGFIPCKAGDVLYVKGASFDQADGWTGIAMYNASFNRVWGASYVNIMSGSMYYQGGERTEDGLKITLKSTLSEQGTVAYVRLTFHIYDFSSDPFISVNEEIKYTNYGFLADGIKVKGDAVLLTSPSGKTFVLSISDNGVLSAEQVV